MKSGAVVVFFLWINLVCTAQQQHTPPLERAITISFENEAVDGALKKISQQGGFVFSYSPSVVKASGTITANYINKTVRQILDELFKNTVTYKQRGNYIILTSGAGARQNNQKVSGYVVDESTGSKLRNVSIYDPVSLASAITDDYGYFQIDLPESAKNVKLAVRKQHYTDTLVMAYGNGLMNVRIASKKIGILADSVGHKMRRFWLSTKAATQRAVMFENIEDTLHRKFQFSLVPFVGTNHKLSGHVINDFSLNMLGGYSLGVRAVEFGGLFNVVQGNVDGAQFAGLLNAVGGDVTGAQFAGLGNATRGEVNGAQVAGLVNFNWSESKGFAAAGLINFGVRDSRRVGMAGIANINFGNQQGPHIAGLFNFTTKNAGPAQVAGTFNLAVGDVDGAQVGGVFNFTGGNHHGAQVSGLVNIAAKKMRGAQIGMINYARKSEGLQLGFMNIADSSGGVPVGFLSIIGKGYHAIEISTDEIFYTNLAFRTGVRKFYNIVTAGIKPGTFSSDENVWTFGYGVGTAPKISSRLFLNLDLTTNQIVKGSRIDEINLLNKFYAGAEWRLARGLGLTAGVTLNALVTKAEYQDYPELFTDIAPEIFHDHTDTDGYNLKMWLGAKVGLRFL